MRIWTWLAMAVAGLTGLSSTAPAAAAPIVYTLTGNVTGQVAGNSPANDFSFVNAALVLTGTGDTDLSDTANGITVVPIRGLNLAVGGRSFTFANLNPAFPDINLFFVNRPEFFGGFATPDDFVLTFTSPALAGYDGRSSIGPVRVTAEGLPFNFPTDQGSVSIAAATNLVFSAAVAVAPVPEPGTWTLMLFGFGAVGAVVRRAKPAAAPLAA